METRDAEWVSLEALLSMDEGPSIGAIATAIENGGIWGVDRYGRFRQFDGGSAEAREALDALAQQYAFVAEEHLRCARQYEEPPRSPLETADEFSALSRYGWSGDDIPDFENIARAEPPLPTPLGPRLSGGAAKGANADLRLIGALYAFIRGEHGGRSHPDFTNQADLIRTLGKHYGDIPGLNESPRLSRRLIHLRGLSHEQVEQVLAGGP